ncbi:hypothetical protein H0H92_004870 [Tricholoma furcatifolium]|nr:hypothetical protein H0H92_004870 [Tricholoma furcatifolium]
MATPASTTSTNSTTSWTRSGEPGSAFNGLRGKRGRGSGRGRGHGGRGGARETKDVVPNQPTGDKSTTALPLKSTATPSTKPAILPSAPPTSDQASAASNAASSPRPKGKTRRAARSNSTANAPPPADASNNSNTSRSSNRRRRSHSGKPAPTLTKISVPSYDDNLQRPGRSRMGQAPHTAPIKDAPPHLSTSAFHKPTDINAVVDRVRAVAVNERPHTPGSHIDWAGDDDDSLPDLDDWGIPSFKTATTENGLISPLNVTRLRPLPGVTAEISTSDLKVSELTNDAIPEDVADHSPPQVEPTKTISSIDDKVHVATPITTTQEPLISAPGSAKVSLRPSLPPTTTDVGEQGTADAPQLVFTSNIGNERGLAASIHSPHATAEQQDPFSNILSRGGGLAASIHAPPPEGISESKSAPSNIASYSAMPAEPRTHNRSHTIGRPPSHGSRSENNGRPSRSGYNTPRGGLSRGGHHNRTQSTPPTGGHNQRHTVHRPVITGDAMSRLARTIGNTTISPTRTPVLSTAHE